MFWGLGIFLGILLCLFKKFEFLIKGGGGVYICVYLLWIVKKIIWVLN